MDFRDSPEDAAFRKEVKAFLASEFKEGPGAASGPNAERASEEVGRGGVDRFGAYKDWMKKLAAKGWIAPAWPKEYGGAGMSVMQQFVFNEEMAQARAPRPGGIGVGFAGPTIIVYGNEEQKKDAPAGHPLRRGRLVPGVLRARVGLRPRVAADARGEGRRRLRHQRAEDLDVGRAVRAADDPAGAHRPGGAEAQGHLATSCST